MKTNAFRYLGLALMAVLTLSLTSCEVEIDSFYDDDNIGGHVETFEYYFRWNWENYAQTSIRMDYGRNDVSYLDDVYIGGNRLSGYLDGRNNFVEYTGR